MWNSGWDEIFSKNEWGAYPPEELVRFVARNFYKAPQRDQVRFLEVGCGPGANLIYLAREGFSAVGLDGSQIALNRAQERLSAQGLAAELHSGDAMALPFEDASFDCVLDIECIYANTLADSHRILAETHRVLKPGGLLFSIAFMVGTYGDGKGPKLAGEPNTYKEITEGGFHQGYGVIRLTSEEEIPDIYNLFSNVEYEYIIRSVKNRQHEIKEWIITCRK